MMILPAGTHLVELTLNSGAAFSTVERALVMMGFEDVILEAKDIDVTTSPPFVAVVRSSLSVRTEDTDLVRWTYRHTLARGVDPFASSPSRTEEAPLKKGVSYDLFFAVWLKMHGGADAVRGALEGMHGFDVERTFCVKRFMRFPNRPGADGALWLATARWIGADSVVTDQDPLFFYAVGEQKE